jgi:hypothetical protein
MSTVTGGQGNIVTNGLVLNLDAANPRSYPQPYNGTTWFDISGNSRNGTLTNGPAFNAANGGSIVFDGTNDTTNFGDILNIGLNSWTMSCWVKFTTGAGTFGIMGKTSFRSYVGRYTLYVDGGNINSLVQFSGNSLVTTPVNPYVDGKFHNLSMTINRTSFLTLYVDGIIRGTPIDISSAININLNTSTDFLYIGSYADITGQSPALFFNGSIANASIYNRALSASEVLQNFNATRARFGI